MGIETSCDETSVAIVEDGRRILANVIASQINVHQKFGGVVPEIASRKHLELINPVIEEALNEAKLDFAALDAVAVTYGPGLVGALLVGIAAAKTIAYAANLPLIGVNHLEGHIYANFLERPDLEFPLLCLVVSGGHTDLVYLRAHGEYELVGRTLDDAAGEAFDKVARAMGLGYPGGPLIDRLAQDGNAYAVEFPRTRFKEGRGGPYDFSFSGIKSAVIGQIKRKQPPLAACDLAASFQRNLVETLTEKTMQAAAAKQVKGILLAGGVACNSALRATMAQEAAALGIPLYYPRPILCTDNGAMIACVGYYKYREGHRAPWSLNSAPNLRLGEIRY